MFSMTLAQKNTLFWLGVVQITFFSFFFFQKITCLNFNDLTKCHFCVDFVLGEVEKKLTALIKSLLCFT